MGRSKCKNRVLAIFASNKVNYRILLPAPLPILNGTTQKTNLDEGTSREEGPGGRLRQALDDEFSFEKHPRVAKTFVSANVLGRGFPGFPLPTTCPNGKDTVASSRPEHTDPP